ATETQYLVAGARIVWDSEADGLLPPIDRNRRATINVTDLLGTTGAVVDLLSGDLVEVSTYYPNGARENLWTNDALVPLEPMGFTTKEADEEIGVTYFGERWLIPRLGRWATPDPLHIHASGGGETGNSYHYVSGNLLQAVDPWGLEATFLNGEAPAAEDGVAAGFYIENDDGSTLYAEDAQGHVLQPPAACSEMGPSCLRAFLDMANAADATVTVFTPLGDNDDGTPTGECAGGVTCGQDAGETPLDSAVTVGSYLNGDVLDNPGCPGGGTCTGGVPGGEGDSASPLWQVAYLVIAVVMDSAAELIEGAVRRLRQTLPGDALLANGPVHIVPDQGGNRVVVEPNTPGAPGPVTHGPRPVRPEYRPNPKHDPRRRIPRATPEPEDAADVFRAAVPDSDGRTWWGYDGDGHFYRYQPGAAGTVHFQGMTRDGGIAMHEVPIEVRRQFGVSR
ncbi:MAG: RHS repeat domain-containing protein, partial [Deltaproteobacteria bacterium]